jgi:hypothetical protein
MATIRDLKQRLETEEGESGEAALHPAFVGVGDGDKAL